MNLNSYVRSNNIRMYIKRYSRHITAHDRIIYDIYDETLVVLVIETEGHYNDK